jgi:hypothetical protein
MHKMATIPDGGAAQAPRQDDRSTDGRTRRRALWVALIWVAIAVLPFLTGCTGTASFADDPPPNAWTTPRDYPTAYPAPDPAPGDFVLRWDGTLHAASGTPAPAPR